GWWWARWRRSSVTSKAGGISRSLPSTPSRIRRRPTARAPSTAWATRSPPPASGTAPSRSSTRRSSGASWACDDLGRRLPAPVRRRARRRRRRRARGPPRAPAVRRRRRARERRRGRAGDRRAAGGRRRRRAPRLGVPRALHPRAPRADAARRRGAAGRAAAARTLGAAFRRAGPEVLGTALEAIARRARRDLLRMADYYASLDAEMARAVERARSPEERTRRDAKRRLLPQDLEARRTQL